jgi:hypothetical protein
MMTVAWYLAGGLAAAATATCLTSAREEPPAVGPDWKSFGELGYLRGT